MAGWFAKINIHLQLFVHNFFIINQNFCSYCPSQIIFPLNLIFYPIFKFYLISDHKKGNEICGVESACDAESNQAALSNEPPKLGSLQRVQKPVTVAAQELLCHAKKWFWSILWSSRKTNFPGLIFCEYFILIISQNSKNISTPCPEPNPKPNLKPYSKPHAKPNPKPHHFWVNNFYLLFLEYNM